MDLASVGLIAEEGSVTALQWVPASGEEELEGQHQEGEAGANQDKQKRRNEVLRNEYLHNYNLVINVRFPNYAGCFAV